LTPLAVISLLSVVDVFDLRKMLEFSMERRLQIRPLCPF
jgi:hypothetical protein